VFHESVPSLTENWRSCCPFHRNITSTVQDITDKAYSSPIEATKYISLLIGTGLTIYNYETVLELIGIWSLILTVAIRSIKTDDRVAEAVADMATSVTTLEKALEKTVEKASGTLESASKVAQEVQAKAQQVQEQVNATPAKDEKPKKGSK